MKHKIIAFIDKIIAALSSFESKLVAKWNEGIVEDYHKTDGKPFPAAQKYIGKTYFQINPKGAPLLGKITNYDGVNFVYDLIVLEKDRCGFGCDLKLPMYLDFIWEPKTELDKARMEIRFCQNFGAEIDVDFDRLWKETAPAELQKQLTSSTAK